MRHSFITFISLAAAAAALVSCAKEAGFNSPEENPAPGVKGVTFNVVAGKDVTKTYLEDGEVPIVRWSDSDKVIVFETTDGTVNGTATSNKANIDSETGKATFSATLDGEVTGRVKSFQYTSVYPSSAVLTVSGSYYLRLPENQVLQGNNLALGSDILFTDVVDHGSTRVSEGEDMRFAFRRLGTVVRMTLKGINAGEKIRQITITAPVNIAGTIAYDPATSTVDPESAFGLLGTNVITLYLDDLVATGEDVVWFRVMSERDWGQSGDQLSFDVMTDQNIYKKEIAECPVMKFVDGGLTKFGLSLGSCIVDPLTVPYLEDFEDDDDDWTIFDADGDGYEWCSTQETLNVSGRNSDDALGSASYINNLGELTPDNWAFTPPIKLTSNNYLSFWVTAMDQDWAFEHYAVYITEEIPALASLKYYEPLTPEYCFPGGDFVEFDESGFEHIVVKIPEEYEGKTVYIGFRHFNCTNMYWLMIDDVAITEGPPSLEPVAGSGNYSDYLGEWENSSGTLKLTITENSVYENYVIRGIPGMGDDLALATFENGCLVLREQEVAAGVLQSLYLAGSYYDCHHFSDEIQCPIWYAFYDQDSNSLQILSAVEHNYVAIVTYENGEATGYTDYWQMPPALTPATSLTSSYEDYLGVWTDGTNTFTIEEDVEGSTYTISGFTGQDYEVKGQFVNSRLLVYEQVVNTSGSSSVAFQGITSNYSFYISFSSIGTRVLFSAVCNEDCSRLQISCDNDFIGYIWMYYENEQFNTYGEYSMSMPSTLSKSWSSGSPARPVRSAAPKMRQNKGGDATKISQGFAPRATHPGFFGH